MKTYENLKRSYGKYLNMDFYVYEPDLEKIKGKNKHEIVYEPIINANKDLLKRKMDIIMYLIQILIN